MMAPLKRFDIRQTSRQILLVLGIAFAVNGVFYALFARPVVREYESLRVTNQPRFDELDKRRTEVESREAYLAALRQAEVDLKRLREDVLSTRAKRLVEVQLELATLTEQFGIKSTSVSHGNANLAGEELDRLEMIVPLEGGYANLRKFLQAVENSDKFLIIERVNLAENKEGGGSLLQLNITLATYFTGERPLFTADKR
jgi:Tfp pilus assembly protein PilO